MRYRHKCLPPGPWASSTAGGLELRGARVKYRTILEPLNAIGSVTCWVPVPAGLWTPAGMGWSSLVGLPPMAPGPWLDPVHRQLQCPQPVLRSVCLLPRAGWAWLLSILLVCGVGDKTKLNGIIAKI